MSVLSIPSSAGGNYSFRRFTVDEYHRMIDAGILDEDDNVELLEGHVVLKMPRNPSHDGTIQIVAKQFSRSLPSGWEVRVRSAITLPDSEPEPDVTLASGDERTYLINHPRPADLGFVVEVANTTLAGDRADKGRMYARANIPTYWIVNLIDRQIEVYTQPSGPTATPAYAQRQDYGPGATVPLSLGGVVVATVPVVDLLP